MAGAVSPSPLSLFVVVEQDEWDLRIILKPKSKRMAVWSYPRTCWCLLLSAPWVLVLPKGIKRISAPSRSTLLGDHTGVAFLPWCLPPTSPVDGDGQGSLQELKQFGMQMGWEEQLSSFLTWAKEHGKLAMTCVPRNIRDA